MVSFLNFAIVQLSLCACVCVQTGKRTDYGHYGLVAVSRKDILGFNQTHSPPFQEHNSTKRSDGEVVEFLLF